MAKRAKISLTGFAALCLVISGLALVRPSGDSVPSFPQFAATAPLNISNTPSSSTYPLIGVDGNGAAYVVWLEAGTLVYFATNRSGSWPPSELAVRIRYFGSDIEGHKGFAVGPNGACHLVYRDADPDMTNYDIWHALYANGWGSPQDISMTGQIEPATAPGVAVNPLDQSAITAWYDGSIRMWDIFTRYRSPSGEWGNLNVIDSYGLNSFPELSVDGYGRAYLVWYKRFGGSELLYSRNDNPANPNGWSRPVTIKADTGEAWAYSKVECDNAGNAYVVWKDSSSGHAQVYFRKIFADGSMSDEVNVSNTGGTPNDPDIGVNRPSGGFVVVWEEGGQIYGNAWQGGWTGPQAVTYGNARSGIPAVAVADDGTIHLVYQQEVGGNWEIIYQSTATGPPPTTTIGPSTTSTIGSSTTTTIGPSTTTTIGPSTTTSTTTSTSTSTTSTSTSTTSTSTSTTSTTTTTTIPVHPKPPLNLVLTTQLNGSQTRKVNTLFWQPNPDNRGYDLKSYRVWRIRTNASGGTFEIIATLLPDTYSFVDGNLPLAEKYAYGLTTVPQDPYGIESDPSDVLGEIVTFEPLNAQVRTVTNKSLFRDEKINIVSWTRNPLNDGVTVFQFNVYRRKSGQTDNQFQKVASVGAGVFEFRDRKLGADLFEYAVTATDTSGFESARSNIVRESPSR